MHCGAEVGDTHKFCLKCGKPIARPKSAGSPNTGSAAAAPAPAAPDKYQQLRMLTQSSIQRLAACTGYYCFNCGCYVDRNRAANYGDIKCRQCGAPIIKPNMLSHAGTALLNYGFIGSLAFAAVEASNYTPPETFVSNYYKSLFYEQNKYPFESVATDKGKMGEYLVDVGYQKFKRMFPQLRTYIFYNLLVPEPNGSFQEIDALIVFGALVFVIEAKNRGGYFTTGSLSDKYWTFEPFSDQPQKIYNPFLQNYEHIAALQHYFDDNEATKDFCPVFANYVTLAGNGNVDWNKQGDTLDELLIGNWRICNNSGIGDCLATEFRGFVEDMRTRSAEDNALYDDKYAQKIIKALMPLINMSEDEKKARMRDRMASDGDFGKRAYQYFYIEVDEGVPYLFRTNWVHEQMVNPCSNRWKPAYDQVEILDESTLRWVEYKTEKAKWHKIESFRELLEVYNCVKECRLYDYPEKHEQRQRQQNRQNNQSNQNSGNTASHGDATSEAAAMFFSGCSDLDSLNARYRSLSKAFHPDAGSGDEETFKKMQAAYESLKSKMSA